MTNECKPMLTFLPRIWSTSLAGLRPLSTSVSVYFSLFLHSYGPLESFWEALVKLNTASLNLFVMCHWLINTLLVSLLGWVLVVFLWGLQKRFSEPSDERCQYLRLLWGQLHKLSLQHQLSSTCVCYRGPISIMLSRSLERFNLY